ncbi:SGNH/GDSL hydrolase family protein [Actinocorallia populi]|uniref:SGNH/GDSL hydrolase family protein n=1 Tax=Actinocorallia populi TaxID=2079200 RepID=UPI000D0935D2|nr:GDSL-type esterase/lipase family protein [Actinocorallia populi]
MKKRILIAVGVLLATVLGLTVTAGYLTFVRSAENPPAEACGREPGPGPVVVAAGASMTQGTLGANWVGALRDRPEHRGYEFVNAGVNGDTSGGLLERVDSDIVACRPDAVTILVGTNDVLDGVPLAEYRTNFGAIVGRIKERTSARIALLSLPPIGEDLGSRRNRELVGYNAVIKETAERARVDYLPLHEQAVAFLQENGGGTPYGFDFVTALAAGAEHHLLGRSWDEVSRGNGLALLVDHLHLNDRGGEIVTGLVARWLSEGQAVAPDRS